MKLIVISPETILPDEVQAVNMLFDAGLPLFHLRKPQSIASEIREYLSAIKAEYHNRIVLHDCFALLDEFKLKGVHLNRRNSVAPDKKGISVSKSCHSLQEVKETTGQYNYVFLSPVFDSISKQGYEQAFSEDVLTKAHAEGIINEKVMALGGITAQNIPLVKSWGFGGVVVLGTLWRDFEKNRGLNTLLAIYKQLQHIV